MGARAATETSWTEIEKAWKAYRGFARGLEGTVKISIYACASGKERKPAIAQSILRVRQRPDACLFENRVLRQPGTGKPSWKVYCVCPKYSFMLEKLSSARDWIVTWVKKGPCDSDSVDEPARREVDATLFFPVSLSSINPLLPDQPSKDDSFVIEKIGYREGELDRSAQIDFRYSCGTKGAGAKETVFHSEGTLSLDADRSWVLKKAEVTCWLSSHPDKRPRLARVCQYRMQGTTNPIPDHFTTYIRDPQGRLIRVIRYECDLRESQSTPEAFTFTAFGLPEPPGVDWTPPTPWYVYAGAAGIILFALCFAFGLWKRRLEARST